MTSSSPPPIGYSGGPAARTSVLAVLSPFVAFVGIPLNYLCCLGLPFALLAILFALLPLFWMKKDPTLRGTGWAVAGLVVAGINLITVAIMAVIIIPSLKDLH